MYRRFLAVLRGLASMDYGIKAQGLLVRTFVYSWGLGSGASCGGLLASRGKKVQSSRGIPAIPFVLC